MLEPWETVQMTTIGKNRSLFSKMLDEARSLAMKEYSGKTLMYTKKRSKKEEDVTK